jgi:hypothetical protein
MWDGRGAYRVCVRKLEEKMRLEKPRKGLESNIKMHLQGV